MTKSVSILLPGLFLLLTCSATAQTAKIDTKHVSDESFLVVRLDIGRMASHLKDSRKSFELMAEEFKDESGLQLNKLEILTLQFGESDIDDGEPSFAITFEFSANVDKELFLSEAFGRSDFEEAKVNGKTYLKPKSDRDPHVYFESEKKFTMATPRAIKSVLNAGGGMGQMSSGLKSAPRGSEIMAVFNFSEKFVGSIGDLMDDLEELPIPIELDKLIGEVDSASAYLNLTSSNPVFVQLNMSSKESAPKCQTALKTMIDLGKTSLPLAKSYVETQLKEFKDAKGIGAVQGQMMKMAQKGLAVGEKALAGLTMTTKEKTIELKVRHMGGMTEMADLIVSGVVTTIFGVSRTIEPADIERIEKEAAVDRAKKD